MSMISPIGMGAVVVAFVLGYALIIFEHIIKINKASAAILTGIVCWLIYFLGTESNLVETLRVLSSDFSSVAQIVFFLLGAMTIVELIDSHKGFKIITDFVTLRSKRLLLFVTAFMGFFLSSVIDNLTSTIVMVSLLRKLVPEREDQKVFGAMMVIATNAGGAWTPIGDVTTTMLWIGGQISTLGIMKSLFIPSITCLLLPLIVQGLFLKGKYPIQTAEERKESKAEPRGKLVFWLGIGSLIFVPILKGLTGLPPFMGILLGLGALWLITDLLHWKYDERVHLRVPHVLSRVDVSSALFFLGILLAVNTLDAIGILDEAAKWLAMHLHSDALMAFFIGLVSAIVDNVPLVAATMGMYDLSSYPIDSKLWEMIAYTAGTGGSILVIGSAAGVAFMGLSKVDFIWYLKRISLLALLGYLAGFGIYLFLS